MDRSMDHPEYQTVSTPRQGLHVNPWLKAAVIGLETRQYFQAVVNLL